MVAFDNLGILRVIYSFFLFFILRRLFAQ